MDLSSLRHRAEVRLIGVGLLSLGAFPGCGSSATTDPGGTVSSVPTGLVGAWSSVCALASDPTNAFPPINLVALGVAYTLGIGSDASFTITIRDVNGVQNSTSGDLTFPTLTTMTLTDAAGVAPRTWTYSLDGFSLAFDFADTWDFNGNGTADETADLRVELIRAGRDPVCPSIPNELRASWVATSMEVSDPGSVFATRDLLNTGGAFSLTLAAGGEFTFSLFEPGDNAPDAATGTFAVVDGQRMILNRDSQTSTLRWNYVVAAGRLTVSYSDRFDFDGNGARDPADFRFTLATQ